MNNNNCITLLLILALIVTVAGCGQQTERSVLIVGTAPEQPPFSFIDTTGAVSGLDIDIIHAIGQEAGITVDILPMNAAALLPALLSGRVDLIIAAVTTADYENNDVTFSDPYLITGQVFTVRSDSPVQSLLDIAGRQIGVVADSSGYRTARRIPGVQEADINKFACAGDAFLALRRQSVDIVIIDHHIALSYIKNNPDCDIKAANRPFTLEYYAVVMRSDDSDLHQIINQALAAVMAADKLEQLCRTWLTTDS